MIKITMPGSFPPAWESHQTRETNAEPLAALILRGTSGLITNVTAPHLDGRGISHVGEVCFELYTGKSGSGRTGPGSGSAPPDSSDGSI